MLADSSLACLSSERFSLHFTETNADTYSQTLEPYERVRGSIEGAEREGKPIERATIWPTWTPESSQALSHQPKSIYKAGLRPQHIYS